MAGFETKDKLASGIKSGANEYLGESLHYTAQAKIEVSVNLQISRSVVD